MNEAHKEYVADFYRRSGAKKADNQDVQLTPLDIATIRTAIAELNGEPWARALYDNLQILVEAGWANARELLDIKTELKDVKPTFAMQALRDRVSEFTTLINRREQDYLNQLLDQGLSEGWTPKRLSSEISQAFADGYHIYDDSGKLVRTVPTEAWSDMVARTELNRAQTMGAMSLYRAAGVKTVKWVTNGTPCDICGDLEGQTFPVDEAEEPPEHPNCNCALVADDADLQVEVA